MEDKVSDCFSSSALAILTDAGWRPDRSIDTSEWVAILAAEGYIITEVAAEALQSFGGLTLHPANPVGPNFRNDEPLNIDPLVAGSGCREFADDLERELGGAWYPFGEWLSYSSAFVDSDGWVVATGLGWIWELGRSVCEAIEFAIMANRPLRCLKVLAPGAKPWPAA
jgi:hypothetical protein